MSGSRSDFQCNVPKMIRRLRTDFSLHARWLPFSIVKILYPARELTRPDDGHTRSKSMKIHFLAKEVKGPAACIPLRTFKTGFSESCGGRVEEAYWRASNLNRGKSAYALPSRWILRVPVFKGGGTDA